MINPVNQLLASLRAARSARGLTWEELAEQSALPLTLSSLRRKLLDPSNGDAIPLTLVEAVAVAATLGVRIEIPRRRRSST